MPRQKIGPAALWLMIFLALPVTAQAEAPRQPQLLTVYEPIQRLEWEGTFSSPRGIAYIAHAAAPSWLSANDHAVTYARSNRDRQAEAQALFELGLANHAAGGFFDRAIDYYKQSLALARDIGAHNLEVLLLGNLGLAYLQNGSYTIEPVQYLKTYFSYTWHQAYAYSGGDPKLGGMALGNLGTAYYAGDLYASAIATHQRRLQLSRDLQDRRGESKALGDLGLVYQALGEYDTARTYQQQRLAIARSIGDRHGEGQALANLGIVHHAQGDYAQAIAYQQQVVTIARARDDSLGEIQALGNLGGAFYFLGDYQQAKAQYEQALAIAWDMREARMANTIRGNLGLVYLRQGDSRRAIALYERFLVSASSRDIRRWEAAARNNLAVAHFQSGNPQAALRNLFQAIERLESLRARLGRNDAYKVSIFETQRPAYNNLQYMLMRRQEIEAALEVAERGRARAFVDLLSQRLSTRPITGLSVTPPNIAQMKQIAQVHKATMVEYAMLSETIHVQGRLQTREAVLLIWVIQPDGAIMLRQVDLQPLWQQRQTSLEDLIRRSRDAMGARGFAVVTGPSATEATADPTQRLRDLHHLLIAPIADFLPTDPNAHVIFIPQGKLFLVPFPALQDAAGTYLVEKHTLLTVPSIQVLDLTHQQRQRLGKAVPQAPTLIVGNPTMPTMPPAYGERAQPLQPLPGAEREAKAVAALLQGQALTGDQATKAAVLQQMPQARIIHLATHGLLDEIRGLGSAVALAPSGKDNGLLTAEDMLTLQLQAEFVVLSACHTGQGRITGDGVVGLSRALISAGAPSVLVSLWAVPDAPTATLMTRFYRHLQHHPDKARALRQAMLATMQDHPAPKDWAAFTLIGEAQ